MNAVRLGAAIAMLLAVGASAPLPRLALPLACRPGVDCFAQNLVDRDPGPAVRDHACGAHSYDGHDGTDIRLPTTAAMRAGVDVVAAAAGTVRLVRDGMADSGLAGAGGRAALAGRECGNGVLVALPGGWETQYCHMAKGSIAVVAGQTVAAGAKLGRVGLSGNTEFPHLHLTVRRGGQPVDPFAPETAAGRCGGGAMLWAGSTGPALAATTRAILNIGFAAAPATMEGVEQASLPAASRDGAALVLYVRVIGLERGDRIGMRLSTPDGAMLAADPGEPLDRPKAQWMAFVGKKRPPGGWPAGRYAGLVRVSGGGATLEKAVSVDIR